MFSLTSTRTPMSFSAKLLSSQVTPRMYWCLWSFLSTVCFMPCYKPTLTTTTQQHKHLLIQMCYSQSQKLFSPSWEQSASSGTADIGHAPECNRRQLLKTENKCLTSRWGLHLKQLKGNSVMPFVWLPVKYLHLRFSIWRQLLHPDKGIKSKRLRRAYVQYGI